jgi:hypothetical protein
MESQLVDKFLRLHVKNVDEGVSRRVCFTFSSSNKFTGFSLSQAGESDGRLCEDCLLTGLSVLLYNLIV